MLVAVMDQSFGTSTFFCSKIMPPGIGDLSVAEFPLDFGVWGDAGLGEKAAEG